MEKIACLAEVLYRYHLYSTQEQEQAAWQGDPID
jgi:hypothetical protein